MEKDPEREVALGRLHFQCQVVVRPIPVSEREVMQERFARPRLGQRLHHLVAFE